MPDSARALAMKDFRYRDSGDNVIEAVQITDRTRWQDDDWPNWLVKQQVKGQKNCVYTDAQAPDALFIALNEGDGQLGHNAWVIHNSDGSLSVMGEIEFNEYYSKVVPVPVPDVVQPADGKTDQEFYDSLDEKTIEKLGLRDPSTRPQAPRPALVTEVPVVDEVEVSVLREAMADAVKALGAAQSKAAGKASLTLQVALETAAEGGLKWCECRPGTCDESTKWGCRIKSPLL